MVASLNLSRPVRSTFVALALVVATAIPVFAQNNLPLAPELSPRVSAGLTPFDELQNQQKWTEALTLVNKLLEIPDNSAYDTFFLNNIKWKVLLQDDKNPNAASDALVPLQIALESADKNKFANQAEMEGLLRTGSNLLFAASTDKPAAVRLDYWKRSAEYMRRYIEGASPDTDNINFYASLQMQRYSDPATPLGPERDALLADAMKFAEIGTRFWPIRPGESLAPKEQFYIILMSGYISQQKFEEAAGILEFLVKLNPKNEPYWAQLIQIYNSVAFNEKDKNTQIALTMRAIGTYERAQALGFSKKTADNEMIVGLLGNISQNGLAAERLERDLKSGAVDNDKEEKWANAALYYQLDDKQEKAISLLKDASSRFPKSGQLDFLAAVAYSQLEKDKESYDMAVSAGKKGFGADTWRAWALAAYKGYNMQDNQKTLEALNEALKDPVAATRDTNLPMMKTAVEEMIKDQEARMKALKERQ